MPKFTRRRLIATAAPLVAAGPLVKTALAEEHSSMRSATHEGHDHTHAIAGHAAMIGDEAPAPDRNPAIDALLTPRPALPHRPGRPREYELVAKDVDIEVAKGVTYPAWTYNGTAPGPVIRATEDDLLRVKFRNEGEHPHTIHFHGIHPSRMDGVFEIVPKGGEFTYEFPAAPTGCTSTTATRRR